MKEKLFFMFISFLSWISIPFARIKDWFDDAYESQEKMQKELRERDIPFEQFPNIGLY